MRVFACTLVDDIDAFVKHLLQGHLPNKFKDRNGKELHEGYLKEKLAKEWASTWKSVLGLVRLRPSLQAPPIWGSEPRGEPKGPIRFVDFETLPPWPETKILLDLGVFVWASDILLDVCKKCREGKANRQPKSSWPACDRTHYRGADMSSGHFPPGASRG